MKNITLISLILSLGIISCNPNPHDNQVYISKPEYLKSIGVKSFTIKSTTYDIATASDSCEYFSMKLGTGGYTSEIKWFHYPQCSYCKSHK